MFLLEAVQVLLGQMGAKEWPLVALAVLSVFFTTHYLVTLVLYLLVHCHRRQEGFGKALVPPTLPHWVPLLGNAIPFLSNGPEFVRKATKYAGSSVPVCIQIFTRSIYVVQGPQNVAAVWKEPLLGSPIVVYNFVLEHIFGMPKRALETYKADDSGSRNRPHPESNVAPHNRVDYLIHMGLLKAFGGAGLNQAFERCSSLLKIKLLSPKKHDGLWTGIPDLLSFYHQYLGAAIIEGLFGPTLLQLNPTFLADLWAFDKATPNFARLVPSIFNRNGHRARTRLIDSIQRWYAYAQARCDESTMTADDADAFWGSELMRNRQRLLLAADKQDSYALATSDLGLMWGSVTNVVPSSMLVLLHILRDRTNLLARVRAEVLNAVVDTGTLQFDLDKLLHHSPLLNSVYAETLRLHVHAHITRASPHTEVTLASWRIPKGEVCMVNSYASHMDDGFWNTRGGTFPLDRFWAERFLVYPGDPESGPIRADVASQAQQQHEKPQRHDAAESEKEAPYYFSVQGLEGAWIPYGGGYAACPGRHFAKRIILYTTALMLAAFDFEVLTEKLEMDSSRFGIGTQKPKHPVEFRIRRRTVM